MLPPLPATGHPPHGQTPTQEDVFGLLRNNLLRRFKIEIETDSTIVGDESREKQDRTQFIESMTKFLEAWGPMVMQKPELAPLAGQLLMFGVRAFRVGRELEEVIEETADKLSSPQAMSQAMAQKGADPKVQAENVKLQAAQAKTQAEISKAQMDSQTGQQEAAAKLQQIIAESQAKLAELRMKIAADARDHQQKGAEALMQHGATMDKMAVDRQQAALDQMPKWPIEPGNAQGF
jgi:hypothetical protein